MCKYHAIALCWWHKLVASGTDLESLQTFVNKDLLAIAEWLKANKLSLNVKKTHYMIFNGKRKLKYQISLNIDGESINEVDKTKFLGVIIDKNLTWKSHIQYICGKVARGIGIIIKARKWLNQDSLLSLYYSFIYLYFIYCNHVWGTTYKTYIEPLTVLQKKIIRIIAGVKPRTSTGPFIWSAEVFDMYQHQQVFNWTTYVQDSYWWSPHV